MAAESDHPAKTGETTEMSIRVLALRALIASVLIGAPLAAFAADPAMPYETLAGTALADAKGMTLYTFDKDAGGRSMCMGPCAANWPPLTAPPGATPTGKFSVIPRDDGSHQWAYSGRPLYTWSKDAKPGDATGDGVQQRLARRQALTPASAMPEPSICPGRLV